MSEKKEARKPTEKPECKECLYSEYDYDGKNVYFLGCRKRGKCTGTIKPKSVSLDIEHKGFQFHISQHEWLSYTGKTVNLVGLVKGEDGEFRERFHAGHYGKFLEEDEIPEFLDFMLSVIMGVSK